MRRAGEGKRRQSPGKSPGKPPPRALIARNPEPQPIRSIGERPGEDTRRHEPLKRSARVGFRCEAEQAGPAEDAPAIALEQPVEPRSLLAQAIAHCVRPGEIGERSCSDRDRRTADRPGSKRRAQGVDNLGRSDCKAETQASEPERLAERSQ